MTILLVLLGMFLLFRLVGMAQGRLDRENAPRVRKQYYWKYGKFARRLREERKFREEQAQWRLDVERNLSKAIDPAHLCSCYLERPHGKSWYCPLHGEVING